MEDSAPTTHKRSRKRSQPTPAATVEASLDELVAGLDAPTAETGEAGSPAVVDEPGAAPGEEPKRRKRGRKGEADDKDRADAQLPGVQLSDSLPIAVDDDLSSVEGEAAPRLVWIIESLLFAANKPLGVREIRQILKEATLRQVQLALKQLGRDLEGRGIVLAQVAGGFRLRTHPENGRWVQALLAERPARLSRSQLETLAVVAYRQPITKPELDHIRGVDCAAVLKVLLDHDLARIVGRKEEPGRPHLYGTTLKFLEFFNLRSLRDMPDLHEFRELTEESRAVVREQLGEAALFDEREAMGQEVLHWDEGDAAGRAAHDDDRGLGPLPFPDDGATEGELAANDEADLRADDDADAAGDDEDAADDDDADGDAADDDDTDDDDAADDVAADDDDADDDDADGDATDDVAADDDDADGDAADDDEETP
ncbi:MAG: SMC-Scp complex subunit ScpB [Deltaproteobacteria bacterium]|nr:SMC-Scp complex subunit ScpB [Deltaproteobacteria bacterium]